jgi:hypothetical protein
MKCNTWNGSTEMQVPCKPRLTSDQKFFGMDVAVHVFDRVIDNSVLVVGIESVVGFQFVDEDRRGSFAGMRGPKGVQNTCFKAK